MNFALLIIAGTFILTIVTLDQQIERDSQKSDRLLELFTEAKEIKLQHQSAVQELARQIIEQQKLDDLWIEQQLQFIEISNYMLDVISLF